MLVSLIEKTLLAISHMARRRRRAEQVPAAIPDGALLLGHYIDAKGKVGAPEEFYIPADLAFRHALIAGGSGAGKTSAIRTILGKLIERREAFVLLDAEGDLFDLTLSSIARRISPEDLNGRLVLIDLRRDDVVGFSPTVGSGDPYSRAQLIGQSIRRHWGEFGPNVQLMADNTLTLFCLTGEPLTSVDNFFRLPAYRRSIVEKCSDFRLRNFFEDFDNWTSQRQQVLASGLCNKTNPWLGVPTIARCLSSRDTLSISKLLERHHDLIVLCALGAQQMPSALLMGTFLMNAVMEAGMHPDRSTGKAVPLRLICDEFASLVDAESEMFQSVLRQGRRHYFTGVFGVQSTKSLPSAIGRSLRANVAVKLYGQNSAEECAEAAREIAADCGEKELAKLLMSQQVGEMFAVVRGQASRQVKLLRTEIDVADGDATEAIRREAVRTYARPAHEIDRELLELDEIARSMGSRPTKGVRSAGTSGKAVRHGASRGRFAPEETNE